MRNVIIKQLGLATGFFLLSAVTCALCTPCVIPYGASGATGYGLNSENDRIIPIFANSLRWGTANLGGRGWASGGTGAVARNCTGTNYNSCDQAYKGSVLVGVTNYPANNHIYQRKETIGQNSFNVFSAPVMEDSSLAHLVYIPSINGLKTTNDCNNNAMEEWQGALALEEMDTQNFVNMYTKVGYYEQKSLVLLAGNAWYYTGTDSTTKMCDSNQRSYIAKLTQDLAGGSLAVFVDSQYYAGGGEAGTLNPSVGSGYNFITTAVDGQGHYNSSGNKGWASTACILSQYAGKGHGCATNY